MQLNRKSYGAFTTTVYKNKTKNISEDWNKIKLYDQLITSVYSAK